MSRMPGRARVDTLLERARDLVIVHGERGHFLAGFLGLLEGVERTRDAALCHVGLAEVGVGLRTSAIVEVEIEGRLVHGNGIFGTPELHEANAQVDERLGRSRIGGIECGLAVCGTRLDHVAELELRGTIPAYAL